MSDHPDIYGELLGIPPGARPPDFYRLLGIAPFEADPIRIGAATKRQVARLSPLLNGEQAEQAKRLIAEIATARAALTTPEVKERYDARLREQPDAQWYTVVPEVPAIDAVPPLSIDPALAKETRALRPVEVADSEPVLDSDRPLRWARQVSTPPPLPDLPVDAPTVVRARLVSGPGTVFSAEPPPCVPSAEPAAPEAAIPLTDQTPTVGWHPEAPAPLPPGLGASIATDPYVSPRRPVARRDSSQVALIVALFCVVGLVAVLGGAALTWQSGARQVAQSDKTATDKPTGHGPVSAAMSRANREDSASRSSTAAVAASRAQNATEPRGEAKSRKSGRLVADTPGAGAVDSAANEVASRAVADRPATTPEEVARGEPVRRSIKAARQALAARDLTAAEEQIDLAVVDASSDSLRAQVDGAKALHHYIERFWNAVRESAKTLDTGHEFDVDGRTAIVVEISRDKRKLVIRSKGQNQDYSIEQLPADVAAGLAERWLAKDDMNSKVFVGAFLAIDAQGNPQRGRRLLEEAKAAGSGAATTVLAELDR